MKYFIAHNMNDVFHFGKLTEEQVVTTGQPYLENFDTEIEFTQRLGILSPDSLVKYNTPNEIKIL